jgi:hypothetical protein
LSAHAGAFAFEQADDDKGYVAHAHGLADGIKRAKEFAGCFDPMTATLEEPRTSRSENIEPAASFQSRIFR